MKKTWLKKMMGCILTGAMITGMLAGCGAQQNTPAASESTPAKEESKVESTVTSETPDETGVTYPLDGDITLTIAMVEEAAVVANAEDLSKTPFGEAWQEATGVKIEMVQLANNEALQLLFAGGDLPDILIFNVNSVYSGGPVKAIKDKVVQPINELMEYAPDLQKVFDENPEYYKASVTSDGDIIGFPFVRGDEYLKTNQGLIIREDWLEDLNMEVPSTPDELYNVLKAFKEEKGAEYPMSIGPWQVGQLFEKGIITSGFGLATAGFYQVDGTVHWGYTESAYKDVLAYMNKLYSEKLLDNNFQTLESTVMNANIMNGVSGVTYQSVGGGIGTYMTTMAETDPNYSAVGFGPLVENAGDTPMYTQYDNSVPGVFAMITPTSKNKEAAAKFLNYGYTEEGYMLFNFGIEGESYTMEGGNPTYTDLIMNNPEGLSKQFAMAQYMRSWQNGPFVQDKAYMEQYANLPQQVASIECWTNTDAAEYAIPGVTIPEEYAAEYTKLLSDANTYIGEMRSRYITGLESLDTFETEYLATLKELKVDRIIEIQQMALDEYNSR